jgi:hypothetical protein
MGPNYRDMVTDLIDSGVGEEGRLGFILDCIDKNKPLYKTDIKFLESLTVSLDLKIKKLGVNNAKNGPTITDTINQKNPKKTLLTDELLDKHLDRIESKTNNISKASKIHIIPPNKKKHFLRRIFSK